MPERFSWVLEERLAGMERPGSICELEEDMEFLKNMGIDVIINLEEYSFNYDGFKVKNLPIEDFSAPTLEDFGEFVNFVDSMTQSGSRIVVHCRAGMGRTNIMIASYVMHHLGLVPDIALNLVQKRRPVHWVNQSQIEALRNYYYHYIGN